MRRSLPAAALAVLAAHAALGAQQTGPRFAQGVDYRIEARLEEGADVLHGRARLRYTNRSPARLDTLYLHQHLNAFRPNSAWATRELRFGNRRFQDLGPAQHAYERFTAVRVDGREVRPVYPGAPDSTVVALPLPAPLAPGGSVTVLMDWDARLSTLPRRQGRAGRHFDFAQWYPRIAVYDHTGWAVQPLLPQGEFYGEFGRYDVTLDVAADQVIGSTGVAVEGDPGYTVGDFERGFYRFGAAEQLGLLSGDAAQGRKRVRFVADSVHHFGWSADPRYRHEGVTRLEMRDDGGAGGLAPIHVLFLPEDTAWDDRVVARRTYDALTWVQGMFGRYPWPQLTNVHRLEQGGTEFPMLIMNGSPSEGLIVHETVHQYLHGILANNEWREGWLDEGFTSFMTDWYSADKLREELRPSGLSGTALEDSVARRIYRGAMTTLERLERADSTQPVGIESEDYVNPRIYTAMTYTKGAAIFRMLREYVGDETFREILREFYARHRLSHVTGADFQAVAERVANEDLDWFFGQWITRTDWLDYGVARVSTSPIGGGRWRTRVEVLRLGPAWMPVDIAVGDTRTRITGRGRRQVVNVITRQRPTEVVIDPRLVLIDADRSNNVAPIPPANP